MMRARDELFELPRSARFKPRGWWWLSFCDPRRPEGKQFLGVSIVFSQSAALAPLRAHRLGVNPGGEVAMVKLRHVPRRWRNKLFRAEELRRVRLEVR